MSTTVAPIDVSDLVKEFCQRLGVDYSCAFSIEVNPAAATVEHFVRRDDGAKTAATKRTVRAIKS